MKTYFLKIFSILLAVIFISFYVLLNFLQIFSRTNILIGQNFEILHKITNQGFLANVIQNFGVVLFINKHDTYQIHEKLIISKHTIRKSHIETKCAHSRQ